VLGSTESPLLATTASDFDNKFHGAPEKAAPNKSTSIPVSICPLPSYSESLKISLKYSSLDQYIAVLCRHSVLEHEDPDHAKALFGSLNMNPCSTALSTYLYKHLPRHHSAVHVQVYVISNALIMRWLWLPVSPLKVLLLWIWALNMHVY